MLEACWAVRKGLDAARVRESVLIVLRGDIAHFASSGCAYGPDRKYFVAIFANDTCGGVRGGTVGTDRTGPLLVLCVFVAVQDELIARRCGRVISNACIARGVVCGRTGVSTAAVRRGITSDEGFP